VKVLRIWLLVLLAVLLPVRAGMAAAMACVPAAAAAAPGEVQLTGHDDHHDHAAAHHDHDHGAGSPEVSAAAGHGHGECNLCSAFCSVTPLPSVAPTVAPPLDLEGIVFPSIGAPAPNFLSSGPERPPRSI
jgi:hypothetical protein